VWIPFPELEPTAKAAGARPTEKWLDGSPRYTIPFLTIESPDQPKVVLTESWTIAEYLEEKIPEPGLFPQETLVVDAMALQYIEDIWRTKVIPIYLKHVFDAYDEAGKDYWNKTRPLLVASPWESLVPQNEQEKEQAQKNMLEGFDKYAAFLDKAGEGSHRVTPGRVSYTEIGLVAWLHVFRAVGGHLDDWRMIEKANGGRWAKLLEVPEYRETNSVYLK
jgi:glutathione S-transferase